MLHQQTKQNPVEHVAGRGSWKMEQKSVTTKTSKKMDNICASMEDVEYQIRFSLVMLKIEQSDLFSNTFPFLTLPLKLVYPFDVDIYMSFTSRRKCF